MNEWRDPAGWFAGPSGENSDRFASLIQTVYQDYVYWRRNSYARDGFLVDSVAKRESEPFWDEFTDKLSELLGRLKVDYPFSSPRYVAHMIAEQSLPSIAGMFAGMLYNPNNVSSESAPTTVQMEIEVARMLCTMLGYGSGSWGHLTSGGTVANIEALWAARSVLFLPLVLRDVAESLALDIPIRHENDAPLLSMSPAGALKALDETFGTAILTHSLTTEDVLRAYRSSAFNVVERGVAPVMAMVKRPVVVLAPETCHYCIPKALDVLGFGRESIRWVPVDKTFRMRSDALGDAIDRADDEGACILAVVAVAGTTEEGAIDPIHEVVEARQRNESRARQSFWIHADAAYGGYLRTMVVPERIGLGDSKSTVCIDGKVKEIEVYLPYGEACDALESLGECDSIAVDPHKLGYVPYPAGAVCFKSDLVKPVLRQDAPYIETEAKDPSRERESKTVGIYALEGSKPGMVAAALWLSHSLIPLDCHGHGKLMQETVRNAGELYTLLRDMPSLRPSSVTAVPLCEPNSNIVCFAFRSTKVEVDLETVNACNRRIHRAFDLDASDPIEREFYVSRTVLKPERYPWRSVSDFVERLGGDQVSYERHGVFLLRSVVMNPWYSMAKAKGRYFLSEFAIALYDEAEVAFAH